MATPIKYTDIYLNSTDGEESQAFRNYLDDNNINYTDLKYNPVPAEHLTALSTWFNDPEFSPEQWVKIPVTKLPILIFEKLFWISEDKTEKYEVRWFAKTINEIPADFLQLADKKE